MKPAGSPEFDRYARDYDAGFDDPLKRLAGADARAFLRPKLALLRRLAGADGGTRRYLDFGCGTGDFLALVREAGLPWRAEGCDVSAGMLAEARRRWPALAGSVPLWEVGPDGLPAGRYDLISAICVFHHIPPPEWPRWFERLRRALRPGGWLFLFEHNSWNPVTRWMVARAAIDANANLISPRTARRLLGQAGFTGIRLRHFLFLPPRWPLAGTVDPALRWLPLGGQYVARAAAPGEFRIAPPPGPR